MIMRLWRGWTTAVIVTAAVACTQRPSGSQETAAPTATPASATAPLPATAPQPAAPHAAPPQPATAPLPSVTLPPELARVLRDYEAAWGARDAGALASLFAENGFVLPNGRPPVRGRAAIEQHYTGHGGPLALRAIAYSIHGSTGYIIGGYAPGAGAEDTGKFTLTLRRENGARWLIMSDMDSSNQPPR